LHITNWENKLIPSPKTLKKSWKMNNPISLRGPGHPKSLPEGLSFEEEDLEEETSWPEKRPST